MLAIRPKGFFGWHQKIAFCRAVLIEQGREMSWEVTVENWDGEGAFRIPDEALRKLGVNFGDSVFLLVEYVGNAQCLVLSRTPQVPDRIDELVSHWDRSGEE